MIKKKTYVLDTSVLIEDPDIFYALGGSEIIIPTAVIKEIDGLKKNPDPNEPRAKAARQAARTLDRLGSYQDISIGARTSNGSIVRICNQYKSIDDLASNIDNRVVGTAIRLKEDGVEDVILVTTDGNMRNVTRSYRIKAENYPLFLDDSVDRPKAKLFIERNTQSGYIPAARMSSHRSFLKRPDRGGISGKKLFLGTALLAILLYLIKNIQ